MHTKTDSHIEIRYQVAFRAWSHEPYGHSTWLHHHAATLEEAQAFRDELRSAIRDGRSYEFLDEHLGIYGHCGGYEPTPIEIREIATRLVDRCSEVAHAR